MLIKSHNPGSLPWVNKKKPRIIQSYFQCPDKRSEKENNKRACDKADTGYSKRSKINCDIFHLFVNASLAVCSLKTTVDSYRIGEVMVQ